MYNPSRHRGSSFKESVLKIDGHRTATVWPPYSHRTAIARPPNCHQQQHSVLAAIFLRQRRLNAFTTLVNDSLMIGAKAPRARMFQVEETNSTQLLQHGQYLNDARSAASSDPLGQDHLTRLPERKVQRHIRKEVPTEVPSKQQNKTELETKLG